MSKSIIRPTIRPTVLGLVLFGVALTGCAGTRMPGETGSGGSHSTGSAGSSIFTGIGGSLGLGGTGLNGNGGRPTLPVPPGCGDGINNQGGIEDCDDGNTIGGDGCNGACHVEPNWNCP